ncbi:unnamed protein product [Closterium sp. NIES-64]|nr:unnamed protein product [Closterium sp. NIES-64]
MAVTLPNRGYDLRTSSLRRRQCTLPCHIIALLAYASFLAAPSRAAPSPYLPVEARNQLLLPGASSSHHGGFPGAHLPARREDLSLKINYTNVYMFCYRETYARMPPTKKMREKVPRDRTGVHTQLPGVWRAMGELWLWLLPLLQDVHQNGLEAG